MSDVVLFKPDQEPIHLLSVETSLYSSNENALINPDMSAVANVPRKYWKRGDKAVVEMDTEEKEAVLLKEAETQETQNNAQAESLDISAQTLAQALVNHGVITEFDLIQASKAVLNG